MSFSRNGRWILSAGNDHTARVWNASRGVLQSFGIKRRTAWDEAAFQTLIDTLASAGYGWLRPEGVRERLTEMAKRLQGPAPLPT